MTTTATTTTTTTPLRNLETENEEVIRNFLLYPDSDSDSDESDEDVDVDSFVVGVGGIQRSVDGNRRGVRRDDTDNDDDEDDEDGDGMIDNDCDSTTSRGLEWDDAI